MLHNLALAIGQMGDRAFLRVLVRSLALTAALFVVVAVGAWWLARRIAAQFVAGGWAELAGVAAIAVSIVGAWLLFRAVAIAVVGIFADEVVEAVERRHYPDALSIGRAVPLVRGAMMGLGSAGRTVGINLLLSPVYLALLVTGVGTAALFFVVNGWLLGRDLGDMVAARHYPRAAMKAWRRSTGWGRFTLGLVGTGLLVVPVLNLAAPVIAAAMATHWYHRRNVA